MNMINIRIHTWDYEIAKGRIEQERENYSGKAGIELLPHGFRFGT